MARTAEEHFGYKKGDCKKESVRLKEEIEKLRSDLKSEKEQGHVAIIEILERNLDDAELCYPDGCHFCKKCDFYEWDESVGISENCQHDFWYTNEKASEEMNKKMVAQMNDSASCTLFERT